MYTGLKDGGFNAGIEIEQHKYTNQKNSFAITMFTNPTFADFNNDGLLDAFVGGTMGVRVMLNEGTQNEPKFGERVNLLRTDGENVSTNSAQADPNYIVSDYKTFVNFIDWDRDGVGDLITTISYYQYGGEPILFHKGVKTEDGIRFEQGVSLIKEQGGEKVLPGMNLIPHICDYNNDGKMDILLGVTMNYIEGEDKIDIDKGYKFYMDREFTDAFNGYINNGKLSRANPADEELKAKYEGFREKYQTLSANKRAANEGSISRGYIIVLPGIK